MQTFYKPYTLVTESLKSIIYPMLGVEAIIETKQSTLNNHLEKLFTKIEKKGTYQIIIVWNDSKNLMTDVWLFQEIESEETGYTVDCKTFRNLLETIGEGLTASDGLIMLGRETELEERIRKEGGKLEDYFNSDRPVIPGDLVSDKTFID